MNAFAYLVLIGFAPLAAMLFRFIPLQQAVCCVVFGGYLFLPVASIDLPGLPDYSKSMAITSALLLGRLFYGQPLPKVERWRWWDFAFLLGVVALPLSYLLNEYPLYNAISALNYRMLLWLAPFWFGRACFQRPADVELLLKFVVGAMLLYVPLCLWEVRMSPQLHVNLYGYFPHQFLQMVRDGGYRPSVFTQHGLVVALWTSMAMVIAVGLMRQVGASKLRGLPMGVCVGLLVVNLVLCKSLGAMMLGSGAAVAMLSSRGRWLITVFAALGIAYLVARVFFPGAAYGLTVDLAQYLPAERAQSFMFRVDNEELLLARAWQQPWIGWVAEEFRMVTTEGPDVEQSKVDVVTDSIWIIVFGTSGLIGLVALYSVLFAGVLRTQFQAMLVGSSKVPTVAWPLAAALLINVLDTLPNACFGAPSFILLGAALGLRSESGGGALVAELQLQRDASGGQALLMPRGRWQHFQ